MGIDSRSLIKTLNPTCLNALQGGGRALPITYQSQRRARALAVQAGRVS